MNHTSSTKNQEEKRRERGQRKRKEFEGLQTPQGEIRAGHPSIDRTLKTLAQKDNIIAD
jgi:hypothetical protein